MRHRKILFLILSLSLIWAPKAFALPDWYINPSAYTATSLKPRIDRALHSLTESSKAPLGQVRAEFDYLKEIIQREMSLLDPSLTGQEAFLIEEESGLYRSASSIIFEHLSEIYTLHPFLVNPDEVQSLTDLASDVPTRDLYSFAINYIVLLPSKSGFYLYEKISDRLLEAGNYIGAAFYFGLLQKYSGQYALLSSEDKTLFDRKSAFCLKKSTLGMSLITVTSYGRIPFLLENAASLFSLGNTTEVLASNPIEKMWNIIDDWVIKNAIAELRKMNSMAEFQERRYFFDMGNRLAKVKNLKKLNKAIKSIEELLDVPLSTPEGEHPGDGEWPIQVAKRAAILLGRIGSPLVSDSLIQALNKSSRIYILINNDGTYQVALNTALQMAAIDALGQIGKKDPVTVELLILALRDENSNAVTHAAVALGQIGRASCRERV